MDAEDAEDAARKQANFRLKAIAKRLGLGEDLQDLEKEDGVRSRGAKEDPSDRTACSRISPLEEGLIDFFDVSPSFEDGKETDGKSKDGSEMRPKSMAGGVNDCETITDKRAYGNKQVAAVVDQIQELDEKRRSDDLQASLKYATRAKEFMSQSRFIAAIRLNSLAISLQDQNAGYFRSRSYCHVQVNNYKAALEDAEEAIRLDPNKPKSHFLKGQALVGLEIFEEAEKAYRKAQELNPSQQIYREAQLEVRRRVLIEMGCDEFEALVYAENHESIQTAVDNLLERVSSSRPPTIKSASPPDAEPLAVSPVKRAVTPEERNTAIGWMDERSCRRKKGPVPASARSHSVRSRGQSTESTTSISSVRTYYRPDRKEIHPRPENIYGFTALWVGNLYFKVRREKLENIFENYGRVTSIALLPNEGQAQACAFINYDNPESPRDAIHDLFQENIFQICKGLNKVKLRFAGGLGQDLRWLRSAKNKQTEECISWRTTGCKDRITCKAVHHKICRGIDYQLRMKNYY